MRYSIIFASLAAVAVAAPMGMKDTQTANTVNEMKPNDDSDYTEYGAYGKYAAYGDYPEGAAKVMAKANMKRDNMKVDETMNDAAIANMVRKENMLMDAQAANTNIVKSVEMLRRDMEMKEDVDAKQTAGTTYGSYGSYGKYSDYGSYPGGIEEEAKKMDTGR